MHKHPTSLADSIKAYADATSSSVRFLTAENEKMDKVLQATKQGGEHVIAYARAELRRLILDEVSPLETFMQMSYSRFTIVHKSVVVLNDWQQHCARRAHILSNLDTVVYRMQIWTIRYKGSPSYFPKMMKPKAVELNESI